MDHLETIQTKLDALEKGLLALRREVAELKAEFQAGKHPIDIFLRQRGLSIMEYGVWSQMLLPANASPEQSDNFYRHMRRYSFRLFLRDLIQYPEGTDLNVLTRYCSLKTVRSYLDSLATMRIAEIHSEKGYRLVSKNVVSFGPTLEWFVSEIFRREFLAPALFNVRLLHSRHGGDYDVIALLADRLVYVEVKSSPPRGVELPAITSFLKRLQDIFPSISVFLVDTELRMQNKIVPLFSEALDRFDAGGEKKVVERLENEIFHIEHSTYLINSRKGIYTNLRRCFRDHLQWKSVVRAPGRVRTT